MVDIPAGDDWFDLFLASKKDGTDFNYDQITEHIFLGGFHATQNLERLKDVMQVSAILTVGSDLESHFPEQFKYKVIEIIDDKDNDIKQHLMECIEFIESIVTQDKRIYVHCAAGVSRSASVVLAYTMYT